MQFEANGADASFAFDPTPGERLWHCSDRRDRTPRQIAGVARLVDFTEVVVA